MQTIRSFRPEIPWQELWLTTKEVASFTGFKERYINETLAKRADFPKPSQSRSGKNKTWKAGEIDAWMKSRTPNKIGRPRVTTLRGG